MLLSKYKLSGFTLFLALMLSLSTVWGSGNITPCILSFVTRWRWVVSFTLRQFYFRQKSSQYSLAGDFVGCRASVDIVMKRNVFAPAGNETLPLQKRISCQTRQRYSESCHTSHA